MHFEQLLRAFIDFFDAKDISYAAIGDVALRALGVRHVTPHVAFLVDPGRREEVIGYAESRGYRTTYDSTRCSTHCNESMAFAKLAFVYRSVSATVATRIGDLVIHVAAPEVLAAQSFFYERNRFAQAAIVASLADAGTRREWFEQAFGEIALAIPTDADLDALARAKKNELPVDEWLDWNTFMTNNHPIAPITNSLQDEPFEL